MTKRRKIWLTCFSMLILGILIWAVFFPRFDPGPSYNGKTLSEWVMYPDAASSAAAIQHFGSNGIPYLLDWIQYERPAWKYKLRDVLNSRFGYRLSLEKEDGNFWRASTSAAAFKYLGKDAEMAIPLLREQVLGRKPGNPYAMQALAYMGQYGLPTLLEAMTDPEIGTRLNALFALRGMGTNVQTAVP